jgi:hypothetical protein
MKNERIYSAKSSNKGEDNEGILQKLPFRIVEVSSKNF